MSSRPGDPRAQTHVADLLSAQGADRHAQMHFNMSLMHRALIDIVVAAGGEVRLPAGFHDRITSDIELRDPESVTFSLDPETGEQILRVVQTPDAYRRPDGGGPGVNCGTTWRRELEMDKGPGPTYEVERVVEKAGERVAVMRGPYGLTIDVPEATLAGGLDGWRRQ